MCMDKQTEPHNPKLLNQLRNVLRVKHYSYRTKKSCICARVGELFYPTVESLYFLYILTPGMDYDPRGIRLTRLVSLANSDIFRF